VELLGNSEAEFRIGVAMLDLDMLESLVLERTEEVAVRGCIVTVREGMVTCLDGML